MLGGINPYIYSFNSPTNLIDPWGLKTEGQGFSFGGALLGASGSLTVLLVTDDKGDSGLSVSGTFGGESELAGVSAMGVLSSTTSATSINDLNGVSGVVGIGADRFLGYNYEYEIASGYTGHSHLAGLNLSVVPFNLKGGGSVTKVYNFREMLEDFVGWLLGVEIRNTNTTENVDCD